jgi:tetratricopeptide (TPR) repeat protein/transcriptional regulator with XRE-family HTH domain
LRLALGRAVVEEATSLAELLKQLRTAAQMTQEELAEAAGLSPRSISDLERGINLTARRETTRLLADALGLQGSARAAFEATARGRRIAGTHPLPNGLPKAPDAATAPAATRTLPRDIATFTGRDAELVQLVEVLEDTAAGTAGVVSIHAIDGMAGIGKTAFAVHAAHRLSSRFPDGQIFLRLHGHTPGQSPAEPTDALATLLLTIGIPAQQIPADMEARAGLWRDRMSGKRVMLVLDDATGSEQVRPLLPGAAGTLVLVTSRRRLAALPDALSLTLDILRPGQAAELFARLVGRADVRASDSHVADVARLCGYLPLAISLMAGQLKHHHTWTAADLATDLALASDRLAAMHAEDHSVAAAFDLSYRDLTADRQLFFRRLGLQPGPDIDSFAAAAVTDTTLSIARALLEDLYAHHLIDEPARGRYRFHDLIREHARALAAGDEPAGRDMAIARLLGYYLQAARAADRRLARRTTISLPAETASLAARVPDLSTRRQALTWMEAERLNLHAAVDAFSDRTAYTVAIPVVMHGFLRINGHWGEALTLHTTALDAARQEGDLLREAAALANIGDIQYLTGDYPAATASLEEALDIFRSLGNQLGEANSLSTLGLVQLMTGGHIPASASHNRSLQLYRALGDPLGEAVALSELGNVQHLAGDDPTAAASLGAALELLSNLGDQNGQAYALILLSAVQQATGDYSSATASMTRALELYHDTGTPWGEAIALLALGDMQRLTGDHASATASLNRALQLYGDLGHRNGEAEALNSLGELALATGLLAEARVHHTQALAIARDITAPLEEARALEGIARCYLHDGQDVEGRALLSQALAIYRRLNSPHTRRVAATLGDQAEQH